MRSRLLMVLSAAVMAALGMGMSFLPQELLGALGVAGPGPSLVVLIQVMGALYLGFAILNWMARGNPMGGIYSRPLTSGNLLHFAAAAIALSKASVDGARGPAELALTLIYVMLAIWFGAVLFTSPVRSAP